MQITALMEDHPGRRKDLIAEHGLSFYVSFAGKRILFDCGSSEHTLWNAQKLGIELEKLDAVVLSHSHYDHASGFRFLTQQHLGSGQVYTGPGFFEPKYAKNGVHYAVLSAGFDAKFLEKYNIQHQQVNGVQEVFSGAYLVADFPWVHPMETIPERFVRLTDGGLVQDDFRDEICLALDAPEGLVLLVGCAHPGILNMVCHARTVLGKPVQAVLGGTHLVEADAVRAEKTVNTLKEMGVKLLGLSHCSGEAVQQILRERHDLQSCHLGPGDCLFF